MAPGRVTDQTETVRALPLIAVLAALVAAPAVSGAAVDPKDLVLRPGDVPSGFWLDTKESGLRTNEREAREHPESREPFRRWRRVTGYLAEYDRRDAEIVSRADLFRNSSGARAMLRFVDREFGRSGFQGLRRAPAGVGVEGWIYTGRGSATEFTAVYWRHGRVCAAVAGIGVSKSRVLALARAQQKRVAAALR